MSNPTNPNNSTPCIDIGANLTHKSFRGDVERVMENARAVGLEHIVVTGTSIESSRAARALSEQHHRFLSFTAGIHPHDATTFDADSIARLRQLAKSNCLVAIGECGLDFNRDFSPRDVQRVCFEAQLELAANMKLPLFLHERDAHETVLGLLRGFRDRLTDGVVHCFTGTESEARAYLELDLHLGVTGWICDERRGLHLRELVKMIPADRLMVETDSPYLAPRDLRPRVHRNEPKYLPHILQHVAVCRGVAWESLAAQVLATTRRFFRLTERSAC